MGISYDRLGNYSRAVGCYTAALKINPDLDYVHNNMGYSYLLQGQAGQAATAFQKAIALNRTNDRYRNNLGVAYAQMGKVHLALAEFKSTEKNVPAPAPAAPSASDTTEAPQAADQQGEGQTPVAAGTLVAALEPEPIRVETAPETIASLPIGVEPAPRFGEKIQPEAEAMTAAQFDAEEAKPVPIQAAAVEDNPGADEKVKPEPVQAAAVEDNPRAAEKIQSAPVQTVASASVAQLSGTAKSAPPLMAKPLSTGAQARHSEKQVVETVKIPEPLVITVVPQENTLLARSDSRPAQATPARQEKTVPAQAAPGQQIFVTHLARVEVADGSGGKGMANWWGNHLRQQGVPVAQFTMAGSNYPKTKIYYCEGYLQEAFQIAKKIPLYQEFERVAAFEGSKAKIRVVIGRDVLRFAHKDAKKIIVAQAEI
jgi:hypothetical protein